MKQIKKLKIIVVLAASLLLLLALFAVVNAQGHTADQLENAGWACINAGPHNWVHCFPPAAQGNPATIQVKVFDDEGNNDYLGAEILIHQDVYHGQPCMTDGGGPYEPVPETPYLACHHFATD